MDRRARALIAVGALVAAGLAGCAGTPGGVSPTAPTWSPRVPGETPVPVDDVTFDPCPRTPAGPARSDLRPRVLTPDDATVDVDRYGEIPVDGELLVEDVGDLLLVDGRLAVGNGAEVLLAGLAPVAVADGTVAAAMSVSVLDSAYSGRRVAFVEARITGEPPVRWEESEDMVVLTDGGDAGYLAPGSALLPADLEAAGPALGDALFADDGVCALRRGGDGTVDGVVTTIGWGDGWYPVYVGRAADGTIAAVVTWGLITPWEWSGLPGTPPEGP